jgi:hypothetical protein
MLEEQSRAGVLHERKPSNTVETTACSMQLGDGYVTLTRPSPGDWSPASMGIDPECKLSAYFWLDVINLYHFNMGKCLLVLQYCCLLLQNIQLIEGVT